MLFFPPTCNESVCKQLIMYWLSGLLSDIIRNHTMCYDTWQMCHILQLYNTYQLLVYNLLYVVTDSSSSSSDDGDGNAVVRLSGDHIIKCYWPGI